MANTPQEYVANTYNPRAHSYVSSQVHASGPDLEQIKHLLSNQQNASVLDLGCGGGHVSYNVASLVKSVIACDVSQKMLDAVQQTAKEKSLFNITTQNAPAESLPFADQQFDWVISRFSSHHWHNLAQGIYEIQRVLKPTGTVVIIDTISSLDKTTDSFLQTIELLRDHSHVRNYNLSEYTNLFSIYGLKLTNITQRDLDLEFDSWIARTKPSEICIQAIIELQTKAPAHVKVDLKFKEDHSFSLPTATFILRK
ncbi:class I SAM-dependent methyltransferase [Commensalibacter papalotli (ex Servin-Garciduenas et al. 2014)]|uniref:Type 11 methyltransferase n=1 Tax=Commensalibacter papalotli (ex Servin-Garciduenas et al. 2014) TaxID=1208583 RepID=W7DMI3_9PROT|nr:class I SAM-dependent methyltransferase [Commensalibacter papalotli (ex Servin-Garciduenas et al. 2014)]EUK18527.1 type 11 methyltransferase [Commensalibacter papalotli (ex Servin-Garciduenas et al. 2014)]